MQYTMAVLHKEASPFKDQTNLEQAGIGFPKLATSGADPEGASNN